VSGQKAKQFRRYLYRLQGSTSYAAFAKFLGDLHSKNVACAFTKLRLSGRSSSRLSLSAELYFLASE
jgi:hypothetical protein